MTHRPIRPPITLHPGSNGHNLLRRVMRIRADQALIERITLVNDQPWRISLRDTGPNGTQVAITDRATSLHILWAKDDEAAAIQVGGREIAIAPGDTITLPPGVAWSASSGMILCDIAGSPDAEAGRTGGLSIIEGTHGVETFHGYNRRTTYPSPPGLTIGRWKITQPLTLPEMTAPYVIVDLIAPLALVWKGGTDLIGRGECRIIPPGAGPITLLPDGLGYALIVRQARTDTGP